MAVSLDGKTTAHGTATALAATLTTVNAGDVIVITGFALSGPASTGSVAITDNFNGGAGLTWNSRFSANDNAKSVWNYVFWAVAPAAITSGSVTSTFTISGFSAYQSFEVFGVSGANTSTPFDPQGGTVYLSNGTAAITTSTANDFVFGMGSATGTQTGVTPWTLLDDNITAGALLAEYRLASGTGTFTYSFGGSTIYGGSLVDALVPASGGGAVVSFGSLTMMGVG